MRFDRQIPFEPTLAPASLRSILNGHESIPSALEGRKVEWLSCGTAAVYRTIQALSVTVGELVLMPDYNCGVEVDAVLHAGAQVEYYRTLTGPAIDMDDLAMKVRNPAVKAIYVIHYFGFAQPINEVLALAKERQKVVIEDCAHALYSESMHVPLGSSGDYAIFSPRKFLPLSDGGVLTYSASARQCRSELCDSDRFHTLREAIWLAGGHLRRQNSHLRGTVGRALQRMARGMIADDAPVKPLSQCGSSDFESMIPRINRRMSSWSQSSISATDHSHVIDRRRENYLYLLSHFPYSKSFRPLRVDLPAGACPLVFPVLCVDRDKVHRSMHEHGVETFRYWEWKHPTIPCISGSVADKLRSDLLAVPTHQDLDQVDLDYIINCFKDMPDLSNQL